MTTPHEIGKSNAEMAIDQQGDFGGLAGSLPSFYENMLDTLGEYGMTTEAEINAADRAYVAVVNAHGITGIRYR